MLRTGRNVRGVGGATGIAAEATPVPSQSRGLSQGLGAPLPPANFASLEKNGMTNRKLEYWVIPPKADGEFVANMEEVLETYAIPYNPARPVLGMDEQPVQLLKETRVPIPATRRHGRRVDYEYERRDSEHLHVHRTTGGLSRWPFARRKPRWTGRSRWLD